MPRIPPSDTQALGSQRKQGERHFGRPLPRIRLPLRRLVLRRLIRILAGDFVGVDPKGRQYEKTEMISETRNAPKYFVSNHLNDVKIRFYGDAAIAQGNESWQRHTGERGRFVWTDTWIRRHGRWQIVAAEDLDAPESSR